MKRVLMVALDFPPCQSAGVQRTAKFVEYLPEYNWQPSILTGQAHMYDRCSETVDIPNNLTVYRGFGLNTLKQLSFKGKHLSSMLKPDRFFSWYWHGVIQGKKAIKEQSPDVLWSTFPCSTSMKIAVKLKQLSGLPWVADFRDPFAGNNPYVNADNKPGAKIDADVVKYADKLVFSTQKTAELYQSLYPDLADDRVEVITNGYNEEVFEAAEARLNPTNKKESGEQVVTLLHSGALYPVGRDPEALLRALSALYNDGLLKKGQLTIVFRSLTPSEELLGLIEKLSLVEYVFFKPSIPYAKSIDEMLESDALLLLQGEMFNKQIPGKAYEYLRTGKPILALTHQEGATSDLLKPHAGVFVSDMTEVDSIKEQLLLLIGNLDREIPRSIEQYSRRATAKELSVVLNGLV